MDHLVLKYFFCYVKFSATFSLGFTTTSAERKVENWGLWVSRFMRVDSKMKEIIHAHLCA